MQVEAPPLPYSKKALSPTISEAALKEHYEGHFLGYIRKLNAIQIVANAPEIPLEHFILKGAKDSWKDIPYGVIPPNPIADHLFNMASQVYNHVFFWNSMKHKGGGEPEDEIASLIDRYGGLEKFRTNVIETGDSIFGSGWIWICLHNEKIEIIKGLGATPPIVYQGYHPLLTIDVWEHAYYVDYRSKRREYIGDVFDNLLNWDFANENLENA